LDRKVLLVLLDLRALLVLLDLKGTLELSVRQVHRGLPALLARLALREL
jgi:hypothetical protein